MSEGQTDLPAVELLGALTYGQLRAYDVTASAIRVAPDARTADRLADFSRREYDAYVLLRDHLVSLTDLGAAVIDRQKAVFDEYFDAIRMTTWWEAITFFATGLPLAADFVKEIAPSLAPATAEVVVTALADRGPFESYALKELAVCMEDDDERTAEVKSLVADVVGRALTGFQGAVTNTDALQELLKSGGDIADADSLVRRMAVNVLAGHRRRMHALGIEDLD